MSIVKATGHSSKSAGRTLDYCMNEKKTVDKETNIKYVEGFGGCSPDTAKQEFALNKEHWNKTEGRQVMHYINSFPAGEVTPAQAMDETRELISRTPQFQGYQGIMACHCDGQYIHVHIATDSVSVENGKKFQMGPDAYKRMKEINQEICKEQGLSVVPMKKRAENIRADDMNKYKVMEKGDSAIERCMTSIHNAQQTATDQDEFIRSMKDQGWTVNWSQSRKNITFTSDTDKNKGGKPVKFRDSNLSKTFQENIGKEQLEHAFEENRLCRTADNSRIAERADQRESEHRLADTRERRTQGTVEELRNRFGEVQNIGEQYNVTKSADNIASNRALEVERERLAKLKRNVKPDHDRTDGTISDDAELYVNRSRGRSR